MKKPTFRKRSMLLFFVLASALSFSKSISSNTLIDTNLSTSNSYSSTTSDNKLWLNLTSNSGVFNQILIGYVEGATDGLDAVNYDAPKTIGSNYSAALYSCIPNSNKKFIIQGKYPTSIHKNEIIKLGFGKITDPATLYTLSISKIQGDFLSNNPIYIKDNLLNKMHDLTQSNYTFTSEVGEFNHRFEIRFSMLTLTTENETLESTSLKIVELDNDNVQFTTSNNLSIKAVQIFNILGKELYSFKGKTHTETYKLSNLHHSVFIAKVTLSNGAVITKKGFKR
ncbi:hypothetical protein ACFSKN_10240 [Mariniflexile gromovii]|uniref:Secreted protein (Por secretion system target) n=1 Tax=Mariniflexile gromovii TaxID=362523 RepID=A0ABS4BZN3_9FLAO|nr:hypothetical protein [Mariniflexile gromovii]MBP0905577.1 hypothetical protein [Mariniflexile gromovii]